MNACVGGWLPFEALALLREPAAACRQQALNGRKHDLPHSPRVCFSYSSDLETGAPSLSLCTGRVQKDTRHFFLSQHPRLGPGVKDKAPLGGYFHSSFHTHLCF